MNTDAIDKFGHCVVCHKNLLTKRVVDGKVVDMLMPIYSDTTFMLNTGSQMQVTICKPCKEVTDLNDPETISNIMEAVVKGWQLETQLKVDSKEMEHNERESILKQADTLVIDCNIDKMDKYAIQEKVVKLLKLKVEAIIPVEEEAIK